KPFNMKEVVLRVNNIIRRSYRDDLQLEVDGYLIDEKQRKVSSPNLANDIDLTTKEFELLILFVHNKGTAFSREDILNKIWGTDYFSSDRVVDDTLRRLRKKMPDLNIHTLYGFGYRLD
ncbi:MAG: response regulator transcription factor, partial [Erysipelotrichaceae bacterium]|nr:response regulator transcription factor [Erysipelotrichaceae bacterium]